MRRMNLSIGQRRMSKSGQEIIALHEVLLCKKERKEKT
jgi:hypothetical protein